MKKLKFSSLFILSLLIINIGCKKEFPNINQASSTEILNTKEGILSLSVALKQYYSTSNLGALVVTTGCTSREIKGVLFINNLDLETGGSSLPNDNNNLSGLFSTSLRTMSTAEDIIANAPGVFGTDAATLSGVIAHAKLFKAMAIGALSTGFEQCPTSSDRKGKVTYVPRIAALQAAIQLLNEASATIATTAPSATFNTRLLGADFKLLDCINAYNARLNLMAGNYQVAFAAASLVPPSSQSTFIYSASGNNPIYNSVGVGTPSLRARENLGLPAGLFTAGDARIPFYTAAPATPVADPEILKNVVGFFNSATKSIPVYLPDEMLLIKAECILRGTGIGTLADAVTQINAVRTQTTGDPFLVYANLPAYSGTVDNTSLLLEVYKQRCAELYLQGLRLEDSRRFNRTGPTPGVNPTLSNERTRNFYPYPLNERNLNSTNVPPDPAI